MKKVILIGFLLVLAGCSSAPNPEDTETTPDTESTSEETTSAPVIDPVDLSQDEPANDSVVDSLATEPMVDPATEPVNEPVVDALATEPMVNVPTTEPATEPATEPTTEPATEPTTEPTDVVDRTMEDDVDAQVDALPALSYVVDSFEFGYSSSALTAKVGQTVNVTLTNSGSGSHNFVIDALGVNSGIISSGESVSFSFTPQEAGSFEFYCSIGSHKAMGMVGTLTVAE